MPNDNVPHAPPAKQSTRTADATAKIAERLEHTLEHASTVASEKAWPVHDQMQAGAAAPQAKASTLPGEAKAAAKAAPDRLAEAARSAVSSTKEMVEKAKDEGGSLLNEARDATVETAHEAREYALETVHGLSDRAHEAGEYALDTVHKLSDRAQLAGRQTVHYVRGASRATGRFVSVHALPLTVVGAGLGWLAWNMRQDWRRQASLERPRPARRATISGPSRDLGGAYRDARLGAATTSGTPMGVRTSGSGYQDF
jgi:hypothetical protein